MARIFTPTTQSGPLAELLRPDLADARLLELFVRDHDQEAFAAVVRRHGPLVLGVCRRVLRNPADADDAFQAAFLVLARRAATLGPGVRLANWLFGVAFNTARRLRRTNLRRVNHETPMAAVPEPPAAAVPEAHAELLGVLDEELNRLPEKYRAPIVLCDLGGATRKEAARALGCPEGTVAGRLARARSRLAAQLAGRGVGPTSCAALIAILAADRTAAVVFPTLLTRAVTAGAIPPRVAAVSEGVIRTMFLHKLRIAAGVLLVVALGVVGVAAGLTGETANAQPRDQPPPPVIVPPAVAIATEPTKMIVTVFSLKKLDPEPAAATISKFFPNPASGGPTIIPLPDDKALLVYAHEEATKQIDAYLQSLGEVRKIQTVVPLWKLAPDKAVQLVKEKLNPPDPTVFAFPADKVLLIHADEKLTAKILDVLREAGEDRPRAAKPAGGAGADGTKPVLPAREPRYEISFRNVPWADVLDWYAKISGLFMNSAVKPTGTVTITPEKGKTFTVREITDILNEALIDQKFLLIRRLASFTLVPADEKIDPTLLPHVRIEDLDAHAKTDLIVVAIPTGILMAKDAATEVRKMLSPFGSVAVSEVTNAVIVTDLAENVRRIWRALGSPPGKRD